jgi:hypothetical protein
MSAIAEAPKSLTPEEQAKLDAVHAQWSDVRRWEEHLERSYQNTKRKFKQLRNGTFPKKLSPSKYQAELYFTTETLNRQELARSERLGFTSKDGTVVYLPMTWDRKCELTLKFDRDRYGRRLHKELCEEAKCAFDSKPGKRLKRGCIYRTFKALQDLWGETGHKGSGVELPMPDRNADGTYPYHQPKGIVRQECEAGQARGDPFSAKAVENALCFLVKHNFIARASGGNGRGRKSRYFNPRYAIDIDRKTGKLIRWSNLNQLIRELEREFRAESDEEIEF